MHCMRAMRPKILLTVASSVRGLFDTSYVVVVVVVVVVVIVVVVLDR